MIERRSSELSAHPLADDVKQFLNMYDLQGLLLDENYRFTAAVEAYETDGEYTLKELQDAEYEGSFRARACFAECIGVPFYIFVHIKGRKDIIKETVRLDYQAKVIRTEVRVISEQDFVQWWKEHKQTVQTKKYGPEFTERVADNYFDRLLEGNGLKWGGNIDGYLLTDHFTGIKCIIENRFTNRKSIYRYDPAQYIQNDINTWKPLISLKKQIGVPLILCTYSNRPGENRIMGASLVGDLDETVPRLQYCSKPPNDNRFKTAEEFHNWLRTIL